MADKLKIGVVSYLNSKPFLIGLEQLGDAIEVIGDTPAGLAERLELGTLDIALLPIATIPQIPGARIVLKYGIAADGPVKTVCLFAQCPLEELDTLFLDYQSRTSVALVQLLLKNYWKKQIKFIPAYPGYEQEIKGNTGGVVIGDRVIHLLEHIPYIYDLAEAWKAYTGLPFVFAAWVAKSEIPEDDLKALEQSFVYGLSQRTQIAEEYAYLNNPQFNTAEYLTKYIQFELDEQKMEGLQTFLRLYTDVPSF